MKISFYILIILIAGTTGLYFYKPALFQSITNKVSSIIPVESPDKKTTIYKWKNAKGEIQISNNPPPAGTKYKTEEVDYSANVMPSERLTGKPPKK